MGPAGGSTESHVSLQEPRVDAEPCCKFGTCNKTSTVTLGVAAVMIFGLLIAVIALAVLSGRSPAAWGPCCPDTWVGYQGKCYYFSGDEGNWTYSQNRCSALGASLAGIDTLQEMVFMLHNKGNSDYWIGLRRDLGQHWKWVNGTEFNHWFVIRGGGDCAFLNDENKVSSSRCTSEAHWICSKPDVFTAAKETPGEKPHNRRVFKGYVTRHIVYRDHYNSMQGVNRRRHAGVL